MSRPPRLGAALEELFGRCRIERLDNGLRVCLLVNRQAPLVATAVWYQAGTRHEPAGQEGIAHFLEHMMFKGSPRFGPGEIDRLTQSAGGSNNAFTGHDATCYYFTFSRDRWRLALDVEADRMAALTLDPAEVERERQVVLEEIAMYEDDPWDALELAAYRGVYAGHPYGRPVLGTRESLARIGTAELARFHRDHYRPDNAVLVVAGDLDETALAEVERRFSHLAAGTSPPVSSPAGWSGAVPQRREPLEIHRRHGSRPRLLVALPAPAGDVPEYADLWLAVTVLAGGRASRLHRALVDDGRLCASVSADVTEMVGPGLCLIAAEPFGDAECERAEAVLRTELAGLAGSLAEGELERARRLLLSDWVFAIERIHQQALVAGGSLSRFRPGVVTEFLRRVEGATAAQVRRAAEKHLVLRPPGVVAWSLPA